MIEGNSVYITQSYQMFHSFESDTILFKQSSAKLASESIIIVYKRGEMLIQITVDLSSYSNLYMLQPELTDVGTLQTKNVTKLIKVSY